MKKGHRVSLTHLLYSLSSDVSFQSLSGKLILITAHLADDFTAAILINHGLQIFNRQLPDDAGKLALGTFTSEYRCFSA